MHGPVLSTTLFAVCLVLFGLGCSEEVPPHFASGTWASTHRTEIENDCDKRVICAQRMMNMYLRDDVFEHCVETNASNLNTGALDRFKYMLGLRRCTPPDACQYVACVDSTFVSAGEAQIDKITYVCQQKAQCGIDTNSLAIGPEAYYDSCRIETVVQLDALPAENRTVWQNQFFPCMALTSCAFTQCFMF